jgi:hypothetical protein
LKAVRQLQGPKWSGALGVLQVTALQISEELAGTREQFLDCYFSPGASFLFLAKKIGRFQEPSVDFLKNICVTK